MCVVTQRGLIARRNMLRPAKDRHKLHPQPQNPHDMLMDELRNRGHQLRLVQRQERKRHQEECIQVDRRQMLIERMRHHRMCQVSGSPQAQSTPQKRDPSEWK
jgi:hypothetical protein